MTTKQTRHPIWWCDRYRMGVSDDEIAWCITEHVPVGEECGARLLVSDDALLLEEMDGIWVITDRFTRGGTA